MSRPAHQGGGAMLRAQLQPHNGADRHLMGQRPIDVKRCGVPPVALQQLHAPLASRSSNEHAPSPTRLSINPRRRIFDAGGLEDADFGHVAPRAPIGPPSSLLMPYGGAVGDRRPTSPKTAPLRPHGVSDLLNRPFVGVARYLYTQPPVPWSAVHRRGHRLSVFRLVFQDLRIAQSIDRPH